MAFRLDSVGALTGSRQGPGGSVIVKGLICGEGIVSYPLPGGGARRELITRKAVEDTARLAEKCALVFGHPPGDKLTPGTAKEYVIGEIHSPRTQEGSQGLEAVADVLIRRADAIDAARSTHRGLSFGYDVDLDPTPGVHPVYGRYDVIQRGRTSGDHVALCRMGRYTRAGIARIDSDSAEKGYRPEDLMNPKIMALCMLLAVAVPDDADDDKALDALAKSAKRRADSVSEAEAERDTLRGKVAAFEAADAERKRADAIADLTVVGAALGVQVDPKADPLEAKRAIVKSRVDSVDDTWSEAQLDGALAALRPKKATTAPPAATSTRVRADSAGPTYDPFHTSFAGARSAGRE